MAILEVLAWPNPALRKKALVVEAFDDELRQMVADMEDSMADRDGVGLAAPQVGLLKRLIVLAPYSLEGDLGRGKPNLILVNPTVAWESEGKQVGEEGCLSFPGVYVQVERPQSVRVLCFDIGGSEYEIETSGLGARAVLHEIDHLNGVLMIDRVSHLIRTRALKKHRKNQATLKPEAADKLSG